MTQTKTPQDMFEERQKAIKKAINQKEKGIAYFNSLNASISLLAPKLAAIEGGVPTEDMKTNIIEWRDWFYGQWQNWYIETNELDVKDTEEMPL